MGLSGYAIQNVDKLFGTPPMVSIDEAPGIPISSQDRADPSSCLPEEIHRSILVYLPTPSVQAVRLSSKRMATVGLGFAYWHSRFYFPNELCHIPLPSNLRTFQEDKRVID